MAPSIYAVQTDADNLTTPKPYVLLNLPILCPIKRFFCIFAG